MRRSPHLHRSLRPSLAALLLLCAGCPQTPSGPTGPVADTVSPKDSPVAYKVLEDKTVNNSVEYHVLVDGHQARRRGEAAQVPLPPPLDAPRGRARRGRRYVYTTEGAYQTPPRTPIAQAVRKSGDGGPTFENKVPLEFWQEIMRRSSRATHEKWKLARKVDRDDAQNKAITLTPYTEPGKDEWAEKLSFNQAMNTFTDAAQALFEKVPELSAR